MKVQKQEPEQHYLPWDTLQSEHKYEKAKIQVQIDKLNLVSKWQMAWIRFQCKINIYKSNNKHEYLDNMLMTYDC